MPAFTDTDAECGLIGALHQDPALVWRIGEIVQPYMFHDGRGDLYATLAGKAQAEEPLPALSDYPVAEDPLAAATRVRDLYGLHILDTALAGLGQQIGRAEAGRIALADVLTHFEDLAAHARQVHTPGTSGLVAAADLLGSVVDDARKRAEHRAATGSSIMGLPTGFPLFDDLLNGLEEGLIVLAGRPGMGKTTLANLIAANIAGTGTPVLYVTYENSRDNLILKHLCRLAGEAETDARRGTASIAHLAAAAQQFAGTASLLYYVEASIDTTVDTIKAQALQIKRRHNAPQVLVIVDYLQKMAHTGGFDEMRSNVGAITAKLRDLSRALASPVLSLASLSRKGYENEDTEPELSDLKESGDIEYGADVVLFLSKGKQVGPGIPSAKPVKLSIKKNRGGVSDTSVALVFRPAIGNFGEVAPANTVGANGRY